MRKSKIKQISLAVCLAVMPFSSFAAGLGKLNVSSGLGEPLKAEVELLSVSPDELATLVAAIANEEAYASQGIPRLGIHNAIKVELAKDASGSPILKLYSNQPVSDPYLDMLIQVDWASGRLQREYTVLLDPPGYKQATEDATLAPIVLPSQAASQNIAQMTEPQKVINPGVKSNAKNRKINTKPILSEKSATNPEASQDQPLVTKRGDTLNAIAKSNQIEGVSLDQMLVGLYEANKEAFNQNNMNRLKVGKIIKVPTKEAIVAVETKQAKETVKVHAENWNAYRNTLAGSLEPVVQQNENKQVVSGKIASAQDKSMPPNTGPKDVVKLSAGDSAKSAAGKDPAKMAEAKSTAMQEAVIVREKELKDAKSRGDALEKQIQDMQKLLALKSQTMDALQKNAEAAKKVLPEKSAETPPPEKEVTPPNAVPADVKPVTEAKEAATQHTPSVPVKTDATPAEAANPPVVKPKKNVPASVVPAPEPSFVDGLLGSLNLSIAGGAGALGLFGALWMYLRNKRRKDLDSFERGILTAGGLRANTVFGNTTGASTNADTSFLTDFAQSTNGSMIDANDVDPIAEAEVYMAYGRDAQAEEILKDAISKQPKRYELHLKLLEIYAGQKDASAFVAIAGELYTTLGGDDPTWEKVALMGAELEPDNPLYNLTKTVGTTSIDGKDLNASDFDNAPNLAGEGLDFVLQNDVTEKASEPLEESSNSVESLQAFIPESPAASAAVSTTLDMPALDFNTQALDESEATKNDHATDGSLDFDLSELTRDTLKESNAGEDEIAQVISDSVQSEAPDRSLGVADEKGNNALEFKADSDIDLESEQVIDFDIGNFALPLDESADLTTPVDVALATDANTGESSDVEAKSISSASVDDDSKALVISDQEEIANELDIDFPLDIEGQIGSATSDLSAFDSTLPDTGSDVADDLVQKTSAAVASAISDISFDLDALSDDSQQGASNNARLAKADNASSDDRLADVAHNSSATNLNTKENVDAIDEDLEANEFDLSGISLDLDETLQATNIDLSSTADALTDASIESPDVEIKLDLVAAYIDMDDKEGARELLEEVMQEGGPQQQVRAKQLLDTLI